MFDEQENKQEFYEVFFYKQRVHHLIIHQIKKQMKTS